MAQVLALLPTCLATYPVCLTCPCLIFFIYASEMGGLGKIYETIILMPNQFSESYVRSCKKINFWAQQQGVPFQEIWGRFRIYNEISLQLSKANLCHVLCSTWYTGLFIFIPLQLFEVNTVIIPIMIYSKLLMPAHSL